MSTNAVASKLAPSADQLSYVSDGIAELALMLRNIGVTLVDKVMVDGAEEALLARHLAEKIGWLAEHGSGLCGGTKNLGDAQDWMSQTSIGTDIQCAAGPRPQRQYPCADCS